MRRIATLLIAAVLGLGAGAQPARAYNLSHYSAMPGIAFQDDYFLPAPELGRLFFAQYSSWYSTDTFRNADGNVVDQIQVTGPRGETRTVDLDVDVDYGLLGPLLLWSPGWRLLGARYGGFVMVPVSNPNVAASLETEVGLGRSVDTSAWGLGDVYAQPLWLEWNVDDFDITAAYGFWAPSGRYAAGADDNTGFGFWGHQFQTATRYRIGEHGALSFAVTGEVNQNKEDADVVPGSHITLNWGARRNLFGDWLQFGVNGYGTWQVTDDSGDDVARTTKDQVHGVGFQVGVPRVGLGLKYVREFNAQDRFEGDMVSVFFAVPLELALDWAIGS